MHKSGNKPRREKFRIVTRTSFFLLFIFAPFLDIFRFDLTLGHFILFGQPWTLGLDSFQQGQGDAVSAAITLLTHAFIPVLSFIIIMCIYNGYIYHRKKFDKYA